MNITRNTALTVENDLYVDHWSEKHNENVWRQVKNKSVKEQKYLGFVVSEDGSNLRNKGKEIHWHNKTNPVSYSGSQKIHNRMLNDLPIFSA